MAALVVTNEYLALNSVEYSSYIKKAVLSVDVDALDSTTMGAGGAKSFLGGLKTVGTSNPKYTGSVLMKQHNLGAAVGDLGMKSLTFPTSGAVTRAEA